MDCNDPIRCRTGKQCSQYSSRFSVLPNATNCANLGARRILHALVELSRPLFSEENSCKSKAVAVRSDAEDEETSSGGKNENSSPEFSARLLKVMRISPNIFLYYWFCCVFTVMKLPITVFHMGLCLMLIVTRTINEISNSFLNLCICGNLALDKVRETVKCSLLNENFSLFMILQVLFPVFKSEPPTEQLAEELQMEFPVAGAPEYLATGLGCIITNMFGALSFAMERNLRIRFPSVMRECVSTTFSAFLKIAVSFAASSVIAVNQLMVKIDAAYESDLNLDNLSINSLNRIHLLWLSLVATLFRMVLIFLVQCQIGFDKDIIVFKS